MNARKNRRGLVKANHDMGEEFSFIGMRNENDTSNKLPIINSWEDYYRFRAIPSNSPPRAGRPLPQSFNGRAARGDLRWLSMELMLVAIM